MDYFVVCSMCVPIFFILGRLGIFFLGRIVFDYLFNMVYTVDAVYGYVRTNIDTIKS